MSTKSNYTEKDTPNKKGSGEELVEFYAYGSLMSARFLQEHIPSAKFSMKADLPNYEIQFRHYSESLSGGTSCIIEAPGQMVRGVLYAIALDEIHDLDVLEGVPENEYKRETFLVLGEDAEWHEADLYRLVNLAGHYTPAKGYLDDMIEGALEHGLAPGYTEKLVSWRRSLD